MLKALSTIAEPSSLQSPAVKRGRVESWIAMLRAVAERPPGCVTLKNNRFLCPNLHLKEKFELSLKSQWNFDHGMDALHI